MIYAKKVTGMVAIFYFREIASQILKLNQIKAVFWQEKQEYSRD